MTRMHHLLTTAVLAGGLALPGIAFAQGAGGGGNGGNEGNAALEKSTTNLPSQRYAVNPNQGQGAALTIEPSGVREVQQALNRLGYASGPLTGNWDQATQKAMMQFQAAHGLAPNGNLTVSSIAAMGLWKNLIGDPLGNGDQPVVSENVTGSPPPRGPSGGNGGGGSSSLGAGGATGGGGANAAAGK